MRTSGPDDPDDREEDQRPHGTVHPTHAGALFAFGAAGVVIGWALRPISLRIGIAEPRVSWLSIGLVFFVAAIVAGAAYQTWRTRRNGLRLQAHQAVNRLVLGKACALAGAALAGGYLGFALAHLGMTSDNDQTRLWHSAIGGVGGVMLMVAALLLEQACRVRRDDD